MHCFLQEVRRDVTARAAAHRPNRHGLFHRQRIGLVLRYVMHRLYPGKKTTNA
jgi:hypothetical protein